MSARRSRRLLPRRLQPVLRAARHRGWLVGSAMLASGIVMGSAAALAGHVEPFRYGSQALGREQTAQVYVPSGTAPPGGWPTLYLLHGLGGAGSDWQALGKVGSTLDRLIDGGEIKPIVVVMPDAANSWYVDSADVKGPGNYETAIGHDLPAAVESAFPVGHDRAHRAVAGLSMGGFGALRLALLQPERYSAAAALSPAIWQNVPPDSFGRVPADPSASRSAAARPAADGYFLRPDRTTVTVGIDLPPSGDHFGGAFGTPFSPRRFNAENVFTLLQSAIDTKKQLPAIFLTVGDDDSHLLWRGAFAFFETMQVDARPIEFRVTDGDHDWSCWKHSIVDALLFVDRHLGRETPKT